MTHQEMTKYYSKLQSQGYGTSQGDLIRIEQIREFILANIPTPIPTDQSKPATIFDASCGRGYLLHDLIDVGYDATGSEASPWLLENELKNLPVQKLYYSELNKLEPNYYNAIVSTDVLEHLFNEDEVRAAMSVFCRASKKWVLITIGMNRAQRNMDGKIVKLHYVVESESWWKNLYCNYCHIKKSYKLRNSFYLFGVKRHE